MHTAVRPYATAGVALVGASLIAVTPVAAPLPDVHIPTLRAEVALTQATNPYIQLITDTVTSLVGLGQQVAEFPIVTAVIPNIIAYATALGTDLGATGSNLASWAAGIPATLQTALGDLTSGDITDAVMGVGNYLTLDLAFSLLPLIEGIGSVGSAVGTNIGATISAFFSEAPILLGLAPFYPVINLFGALGATGQTLYNDLTTGDFLDAATTLLNAPAVILDGVLNGGYGANGAISPGFGTIANVLDVLSEIAGAITPFTDPGGVVKPAASTSSTPSASPNLAVNTVTVTTAAPVKTPAATINPATTTAPTVKAPAAAVNTATTTAPIVTSGTAAKLLTPLKTTGNGNKAAPGTVGGKGTTAGNGLANALSKIGGGLPSTTGTHK